MNDSTDRTIPASFTSAFPGTAAVVTGSTSGIGRATALAFASAGATRQIVHGRRNRDAADAVAGRIGDGASVVMADVADAADRETLVNSAFDRLGRIDTWVLNAGADVLTGPAADWSFERKLEHLWRIDVAGTIDLARRVVARLRDQPPGETPPSMTFIGWDQSTRGMEGDAGQMFGPIKAAVTAFALSLAQDVAPEIRVNVVAPGWIKTSWGETTRGYWDRRAKSQSLMGRWGRPEDVARSILYVANPAATFITGQILEVAGGWNRRFDDR